MLDFMGTARWNTVNNADTMQIIENIAHFIYEHSVELRVANGLSPHRPLGLEAIEKMWGRIQTYQVDTDIIIEAYSIPPTVSYIELESDRI